MSIQPSKTENINNIKNSENYENSEDLGNFNNFINFSKVKIYKGDDNSIEKKKGQLSRNEILISNNNSPYDLIILNAAENSLQDFEKMSLKQFKRIHEVNFFSYVSIIHKNLPLMQKQNFGKIVVIASVASHISGPFNSDYASSKFALLGFHEALRMELKIKKSKISTLIVFPYLMFTRLFEKARSRLKMLFPMLDPVKVALKIIEYIEKDKEELYIPWYSCFARIFYYILPTNLRDYLNYWMIHYF